MNGGQLIEVDLHLRRNILGLGPRWGDAHREQFADVADLARRKNRLVRGLETLKAGDSADWPHALEIVGDEDAVTQVGRDMDGPDSGVRERAAHEGDVLHVGQADVADELPAPTQQPIVFLAKKRGADALWLRRLAHFTNAAKARIAPRISPLGSRSASSTVK